MTEKLRSSTEIIARLSAIGAEFSTRGRFGKFASAKALEEEETALKLELTAAYQREGEEARDAAEIAKRAEASRQAKIAEERERRIAKSVADAAR